MKVKANGHPIIKIEKGVPRAGNRSGNVGFYPYFEMKIGDSFLPPPDIKPNSMYGVAREGNRRAIYGTKPHRFRAGKDEKGAVRVWRIA